MIHDFYMVCELAYKVSGENVKAELQSVIAILGPLLLNDSAAVCSKVCKGVLLCVGTHSLSQTAALHLASVRWKFISVK